MVNCKTCMYWSTERNYEEELEPDAAWRYCTSLRVMYGYTSSEREWTTALIHVEDDEGWGMLVNEEYGCVLHEEKTNDNT